MFGTQQPFGFTAASAAPAPGGLFGGSVGTPSQQTGVIAPQTNLFSTPVAASSTSGFGANFGFGTSVAPPTTSAFSFAGFKPASTATTTATSQAGGLFGLAAPSSVNFGMMQQQPQAQMQQTVAGVQMNINEIASFIASLKSPQLFGDERDQIIARFNQIQAFCGTGKGFFDNSAMPVDYTPSNLFCRFKAICYDLIDGSTDEDGLISLTMKRPEAEIKANLQLVIDDLFKLLGSKPQIAINVVATKSLPDNRTEMTFFVTETGATGAKRRILASEAHAHFNQPAIKQHLTSSALQVEQILLKAILPIDKMRDYLAVPQGGIDPLIWQQAVADNPHPKKLLPQPILGFQQLRERQKLQKSENDVHQSCLSELGKKLERIEEKTLSNQSRLQELKLVEQRLSHKLLTIAGKYYAKIRRGYTFEMSEENLKAKLDAVNAQLNGTVQLKNRLAEISSNSKLTSQPIKDNKVREESVDEDLLLEIRQYLKRCQNAIEDMSTTIKNDQKDLAIMNQIVSS